jgi:p-hydroxybenzoate 3-monooxygenase
LAFAGRSLRVDLQALAGGSVSVYGQTEVTKDLIEAREAANAKLLFEATDVAVEGFDRQQTIVRYRHGGQLHELQCDFVAGCDGYHGVCRKSVPQSAMQIFERVYPFGWLGVLADVPPVGQELTYSNHARGFALCSMRSRTRSRYYIQCGLDENLEAWPDARFWDELRSRLPEHLAQGVITGPSIEKGIAPLRSFVVEPVRFGRMFLVGDAAHIVPPTGAKGLNLAASDVYYLWQALMEYYRENSRAGMDAYSARALQRVWKAERFSWWMTSILHCFPEGSGFDQKMQRAELEYLISSRAAMTALAENYVGLPY